MTVTFDTRVRGKAHNIFVYKVLNYVFLKCVFKIKSIMGNTYSHTNRARVLNVRKGTAGAGFACVKVFSVVQS